MLAQAGLDADGIVRAALEVMGVGARAKTQRA
jgi:hypothetical protein